MPKALINPGPKGIPTPSASWENNKSLMRKRYAKTYHIIFDAFGVARKFLGSERFVLNVLLEIPSLVGMSILAGPNIVRDYTIYNRE